MNRRILEVAYLAIYLSGDAETKEKAEAIKQVRNNGDITDDEALELAIEFC